MEPKVASLVTLRAAKTYFVFPNKMDAAPTRPAPWARRLAVTGGGGGGGGGLGALLFVLLDDDDDDDEKQLSAPI